MAVTQSSVSPKGDRPAALRGEQRSERNSTSEMRRTETTLINCHGIKYLAEAEADVATI